MTCIKYLLFVFNFFFFLIGLALIICGAVIQAHFREYFDIIGSDFNSAAGLLIAVGCIIFIIGFFGCCGAVKENHCMVITFSVLLSVILVMEVAAAITAFHMQSDVREVVEKGLHKSLDKYDNATGTRKAWDLMQTKFHCCGVANGAVDWDGKLAGDLDYPKSCCANVAEKGCGKNTALAYKTDCVGAMSGFISSELLYIGLVGLFMAVLEVVGIVFACCLARSIKQGYENV